MKRIKHKGKSTTLISLIQDFVSEPLNCKLDSNGVWVATRDFDKDDIVIQISERPTTSCFGVRFEGILFQVTCEPLFLNQQTGKENIYPAKSQFFCQDVQSSQHGSFSTGLFMRASEPIKSGNIIFYDFNRDVQTRAFLKV
ncbi:TPA_asm: SET [Tilapia adomavirus 2]|uniref:SET n=1 Tax=Tilapia adomavirus 2 TaxID=2597804 RepID=A0A5H3CTD6_9VIRU|nr:TPA_asm: SET [Tilapia adomavirus 2]